MIENMGILAGEKNHYNNPFAISYPRCLIKIPVMKYDPISKNVKKDKISILEYQLFRAKNAGIKNVYILTGKENDKIIKDNITNDYGLNIDFLYDKEKGTQPVIYNFLDTIDKDILLINGDVVSDVNLKKVIEMHNKDKMTLVSVPMISRFGVVKIEGRKVVDYQEKPILPYMIDGGIYTISPSLKKFFEKPKEGDAHDLAFYEIRKKGLLNSFNIESFIFWREIESLNDYNTVLKEFNNKILKPWGYEKIEIFNEDYLKKELFLMEDHKTSFHYHKQKRETINVKEGRIKIKIENSEEKFLTNNEKITLLPGTKHSIIAVTNSLLEEISTPHPFDTIRINDYYEREIYDKDFSTS
ncbi:MAG: glucose-1-phosphate adenylyltransferase [Candidatus Aenigmarchaeota archaeon]|nr:glucose-1-phosphate adenylyltransferase [Candidatus Aenigmarchaeota archaeon]